MPSSDPSSPATAPGNRPRVSVVIPLFNCLPLTQSMLASLQASLPRDFVTEIIFVDDGSTDGTREWLGTLGPGFRVILNERNLGYAAANNRGAAAAQGEFLVLLNNDLVLTPRWLEPMLETHRALGQNAGLVGNVQLDARTGAIDHAGIFFNYKGKPEHARELPPSWWRIFQSFQHTDALTGACVLIARDLWMRLGGFDEGYVNGCEDVDLCLRQCRRLAQRGAPLHQFLAGPETSRRGKYPPLRAELEAGAGSVGGATLVLAVL